MSHPTSRPFWKNSQLSTASPVITRAPRRISQQVGLTKPPPRPRTSPPKTTQSSPPRGQPPRRSPYQLVTVTPQPRPHGQPPGAPCDVAGPGNTTAARSGSPPPPLLRPCASTRRPILRPFDRTRTQGRLCSGQALGSRVTRRPLPSHASDHRHHPLEIPFAHRRAGRQTQTLEQVLSHRGGRHTRSRQRPAANASASTRGGTRCSPLPARDAPPRARRRTETGPP